MPKRSSSTAKPASPRLSPAQHGQGRELDDDELFAPDNPPAPPPPCKPSKPPRQTPVVRARWQLLRDGMSASPRTALETRAQIFQPVSAVWHHLPRGANTLVELSVRPLREMFSSGKQTDLSRLPDAYAYEILAHVSIQPAVLSRLEVANPTRIALLEAVWARVVSRLFHVDELPKGFSFWRAVFEERVLKQAGFVRRCGERARSGYSVGAGDKSTVKQTRRLGKPPRLSSRRGVKRRADSVVDRLRMEMRRDKRRRYR